MRIIYDKYSGEKVTSNSLVNVNVNIHVTSSGYIRVTEAHMYNHELWSNPRRFSVNQDSIESALKECEDLFEVSLTESSRFSVQDNGPKWFRDSLLYGGIPGILIDENIALFAGKAHKEGKNFLMDEEARELFPGFPDLYHLDRLNTQPKKHPVQECLYRWIPGLPALRGDVYWEPEISLDQTGFWSSDREWTPIRLFGPGIDHRFENGAQKPQAWKDRIQKFKNVVREYTQNHEIWLKALDNTF